MMNSKPQCNCLNNEIVGRGGTFVQNVLDIDEEKNAGSLLKKGTESNMFPFWFI